METIINAIIKTGKNKFRAQYEKEKDLLIVCTTSQPEKNKANKEIIKELKKFFKCDIEIVSGLKSKEKKIKINLPKEQVKEILESTN